MRAVAVVLILFLQLTPAWADRYKDCMGTKTVRIVPGCTKIIDRGDKETTEVLEKAFMRRGEQYTRSKTRNIDKAISDFTNALRLNPKSIKAYMRRGSAYQNSSRIKEAAKDLKKALSLKPDDRTASIAHHQLGLMHVEAKAYDKAIARLTKAVEIKDGPGSRKTRGLVFMKTGQHRRALDDFDANIRFTRSTSFQDRRVDVYRQLAGQALHAAGESVPPPPPTAEEPSAQYDDPDMGAERCTGTLDEQIASCRRPDISHFSLKDVIRTCSCVVTSGQADNQQKASAFYHRGMAHGIHGAAKLLALRDFGEAKRHDGRHVKAIVFRAAMLMTTPLSLKDYFDRNAEALKDLNAAIKLDPNERLAYFYRARHYGKAQFELAKKDFDTALRIDPGFSVARVHRGILYAAVGQHARAIEDYDQSLTIKGSGSPITWRAKWTETRRAKSAKALRAAGQAVPEGPVVPAEKKKKKKKQKKKAQVQATQKQKKHQRTSKLRERLNKQMTQKRQTKGQPSANAKQSKKKKQLARKDPDAAQAPKRKPKPRRTVEQMLAECGSDNIKTRIAGCTDALKSGRLAKEKVASVHYRLGADYHTTGRFEQAIANFSKTVAIVPRYPNVYVDRGNTYMRVGKNQAAYDDFTSAIKLKPNYALAYFNRGRLFAQVKQYDNALKDLNRAIEISPKRAFMLNVRGHVHRDKGELALAVKDHLAAIVAEPKITESYDFLGRVYLRKKDLPEAVEAFRRFVNMRPKNAAGYNNLANAYSEMGKLKTAIKLYDHAIKLDPQRYTAYFYNNRGNAYRKLGNYAQAIKDFDAALARKPDYTVARKNRKETMEAAQSQ